MKRMRSVAVPRAATSGTGSIASSSNRTTSASTYLIAPLALIGFCAYTAVRDVQLHYWDNLVFAGLNLVPISMSDLTLFTLIANGPFAALYLVSAGLFRKAVREQLPAGARAEG